MTEDTSFLTSLHVNLRDKNNGSYRGQLTLKNWTLWVGEDGNLNAVPDTVTGKDDGIEDPTGASYYVIAVVLVYGMSIVMLIASHINRKHTKLVEDRQIHKYLQEFQIVKERSSQESYKDLKRKIKEQIQWDKEHKNNKYLQKNLSHAVLPMIAVTFPSITDAQSLTSLGLPGDMPRSRASSRSSIGHSSPASQPRSRANSFNETAGVHRHGKYLQLPEPSDLASSPRLSRERRKGLVNLIPNFPNKGIDAHHLEKILEESLDSRHSSFRRKDSKRSIKSSSLSSIHEAQRNIMREELDYARRASDTHNAVGDSEIADKSTCEEPNSPDSGVSNHSSSHTPDVEIRMPEICETEDNNADHQAIEPNLPYEDTTQDESVWVLNSDINSDDEEQRDEAYVSGRYSANGFFKMSPVLPTHSYPNRYSTQDSERLIQTRYNTRGDFGVTVKRLSPLQDESEFYSESSSDSEDDGLLHITCV